MCIADVFDYQTLRWSVVQHGTKAESRFITTISGVLFVTIRGTSMMHMLLASSWDILLQWHSNSKLTLVKASTQSGLVKFLALGMKRVFCLVQPNTGHQPNATTSKMRV